MFGLWVQRAADIDDIAGADQAFNGRVILQI
jgi:hypothetical protein